MFTGAIVPPTEPTRSDKSHTFKVKGTQINKPHTQKGRGTMAAIASANLNTSPSILFFIIITTISTLIASSSASTHGSHHRSLASACRLTRHPALCIRTLSSTPRPMQQWAHAAVSATLSQSKRTRQFLQKIKNDETRQHGAKYSAPLSDCIELFGDAAMQLQQSMAELRQLERGGSGFALQMSDVETWVSAALTDHDTCQDGIGERRGAVWDKARTRVVKAGYLASNALAMINELAGEGGK